MRNKELSRVNDIQQKILQVYSIKCYTNKMCNLIWINELIITVLYLIIKYKRFVNMLIYIDRMYKDNKIKYDYENTRYGFKSILYRKVLNNKNDEVENNRRKELTRTGEIVFKLLQKNSNASRQELVDSIAKSLKTIQRILDSLEDKGNIKKQV